MPACAVTRVEHLTPLRVNLLVYRLPCRESIVRSRRGSLAGRCGGRGRDPNVTACTHPLARILPLSLGASTEEAEKKKEDDAKSYLEVLFV